ncbi:ChbG/HpnK family deacetylase, partial [Selenomonas sp.]|uniref:ChbG/HpnK family deacetylase n=1 Tax=Selenomonas sp. TaxID=2053611 RepID=UPI003FA1BDBC
AGDAVDEAALLAVLKGLNEGTTEVMVHPGTANEELARDCGWRHDFEAELAAILSARAAQILAEEGIEAVNFQALGGSLENES